MSAIKYMRWIKILTNFTKKIAFGCWQCLKFVFKFFVALTRFDQFYVGWSKPTKHVISQMIHSDRAKNSTQDSD